MIEFLQPDNRFNVAVGISNTGRRAYIFAHTHNRKPPHTAEWTAVEGALAFLVGDVEDELRGLILEHGNEGLNRLIGISPTTLRALRHHLGIEGGSGHGGARLRAGAQERATD